jgi:hypothetical protein
LDLVGLDIVDSWQIQEVVVGLASDLYIVYYFGKDSLAAGSKVAGHVVEVAFHIELDDQQEYHQ